MDTPVRPEHSGLPAQVWLASRSPRRLELLQTLGFTVQVFLAQSSPEAEALEAPFEQEDPLLYVQRVTQLKLNAALEAMRAQRLSGLVLAADTTVALNGHILGKPQNATEALAMLNGLSNTTHEVHTMVAPLPKTPCKRRTWNSPRFPKPSWMPTLPVVSLSTKRVPTAFRGSQGNTFVTFPAVILALWVYHCLKPAN